MDKNKIRTIYLLRHGCPAYPDQRKYCLGRTDWPLSEQGINEARALGDWFKEHQLAEVYSSPLTRCLQTAYWLTDKPCIVNDLREIDMGQWDGLPFEEIKERWPQEYAERWHNIVEYIIPGGENFVQLAQRVHRAWNKIITTSDGNIAIVAHVGVNRMILAKLLAKPLKELFEIRQPSGCIDTIRQDGDKFTVEQLGYVPLLDESRLLDE